MNPLSSNPILQKSLDLPALPSMATKLIAALQIAEPDVSEIIRLIECEPSIAARVLQLANSPLYCTSRPITTIGHAVVILGFRSVGQLAMSVASKDLYTTSQTCTQARLRTYGQSLGVATLARLFAQKTGLVPPDEAFLCGMFHEVGKLVLFDEYEHRYEAMLLKADCIDTTGLELSEFGTCHTDLGYYCGCAWELPMSLNEGIRFHHCEYDDDLDSLSKITIAASQLAANWEFGLRPEPLSNEVAALSDELQIAEFRGQAHEQFVALCEACGMKAA